MTNIQLVVFDMEGTLTADPTVWEIMHRKNGTWESHGQPYWDQFKAGAFGYDEFARMDVAVWQGAPAAMLDEAVQEVPLMPGCRELVAALVQGGVRSAIISNGLERLGLRVAGELRIDQVEANREIVANDALTGELELRVPYAGKGESLVRIAGEMAVPLDRVLVVGDGVNDVSMFEQARYSVAFMANDERVRSAASHVIDVPDLREVIPLVF